MRLFADVQKEGVFAKNLNVACFLKCLDKMNGRISDLLAFFF